MGNLIQIYHLQTISYTILSAGMQSYSNTYYSLFILISGNGTLKTNHETIHLMKGKCVIIPPNSPVEIHIADETLCFYQLTFNTIYLSEAHSPTSLFTSVRELRLLPFSQCNRLLEAIYRCRQTKDEHTVFEQHVRFQELILFIFEQNRTKPLQQSDRQSVEQSIQYLHNHFGKDWTVEQLAELAGVPKWSYSRIFKDITGQIPLYYLNSIRIEKAKQLLMTTNDRVFEISQSIGFNNEYYFNRRFKEHVGISPGQFRRSQSNNVRVFAPFLEDFFVALGITPIAQFSHSKWGKQDYLGLQDVPDIDVQYGKMEHLFHYKPTLIMLDAGIERWETCLHLNKLAPICHLNNPGEDWQSTLFKIADLTGKTAMMQDIITEYEDKVQRARKILGRSVYGQSVAFLRISAIGITLYAGPDCGYTGPILYRDLGLTPDPLVWKIPLNQRKAHLTSNQLQQLDADHLFITFDKQHSIYENEERTILTSSMWKNLRAVKRNCVYEVDFLTWMNYGILSHSKKIDDVLNVLG
ncbi:helix-turn-helix domain-containing protein [Lysinibacillus sphaericus]|uniref:helix-turn-helix domain-containing protein n=1 Tax=Lysinibacillus TaxID=400634 RepID=UPI00191002AE|nr:helix-turn-helix domain-containing protein [Lysinibacillus sphaericus]MDM5352991.1 helix-turn-helix domain-containing protein [Lysinibacillus sphaericus]MEB7454837.1 helix-turn-helix domain-containing protein [Lysinibacillus sphaericus]QPA54264.1 helix-turn-helix domain-containing protein [Lysinibacillus sphaericus]